MDCMQQSRRDDSGRHCERKEETQLFSNDEQVVHIQETLLFVFSHINRLE